MSRSNRWVPGMLVVITILAGGWALNRHLKANDLERANQDLRRQQAELLAALDKVRQANRVSVTSNAAGAANASGGAPAASGLTAPPPGAVASASAPRMATSSSLERAVSGTPPVSPAMHARATLDLRYADLFRQLNLTPAQLEKLKALLVERDTARTNVAAVATASGLDPQQNSAEFQKLVNQAQREIEATIAQTIGAEGYATFQNYQQTSTQRYTVKQLEQSLSYTSTPLNAAQGDQLVNLLARTSAAHRAASGGDPATALSPMITDEALAQAASLLSPAQLAVLRDMKTYQDALSQGRGFPSGAVPAVRMPGGN
ncbi:MAG: hypothetical protein JNN01_16035 [Opitutaceae bacterium]|nr:hypothetical protein [Opitutaceae bacterium]